MMCPHCKANNQDETRYCRACGRLLVRPIIPPVPTMTVASSSNNPSSNNSASSPQIVNTPNEDTIQLRQISSPDDGFYSSDIHSTTSSTASQTPTDIIAPVQTLSTEKFMNNQFPPRKSPDSAIFSSPIAAKRKRYVIALVICACIIIAGVGGISFFYAQKTNNTQPKGTTHTSTSFHVNEQMTAKPISTPTVIPTSTPIPTPTVIPTSIPTSTVIITFPVANSEVSEYITVQGSVSNIPQDEDLWLLVVTDGTVDYYPQTGPAVISNGTWSANARIGQDNPNDIGKGYTVFTAFANKDDNTAIQQYFKTAPNYTPLRLPLKGIQIMSQVHVIRK